jgi:sulfonate transport system substrate-binding protein
MRKNLFGLILVLVSGLFITGCGNNAKNENNTPGGAADLSKVTLRVGETGWGNLEAGLKAAGLEDTPYKVDYKVFQGGNLCLEAMAADHLDLTLTSEIPPIFASQSANGGNFKIIAISESTTLTQELVVPQGSSVKSVTDLKGKKVAYVNSTTAHYFLLKMLGQAGMTWNDITPVALSTSDGLTALVGGQVDALASYGNAIISAHQQGATELASAKDILSGNFPVAASITAINDPGKRAAIADYLARVNKSYEWARNNPDKWAKIIATNTHQPVELALKTFSDGSAQRPTKIVAISPAAIASEQDIVTKFFEVGLMKTKVDVSSFWSHEFDSDINNFAVGKLSR